jgi:DNA mismatch repair protein MutL
MPDIIRLLPDSVANQIAAGEVIQRPASAVKELLENAIDSGATHLKLIIKDAGKTLVQVFDNGCGMSETDARLSFERHATSKIKEANDLFNIRTMGFRGEALASIAAIAQVEMKTKRIGDDIGTSIIIEGTEVKSQQACQCPEGTSIAVKNLFFNVPARRNFLKSNQVETSHIVDEFYRVAIAFPGIGFEMHHNDNEVHHLPVSNLKQRIINILGANYNQRLLPLLLESSICNISGFIGKPEFAKKTRGEQYFFVNNRFIKHAYLHHAVISAFEELLPSNSFPSYFLFISIDPKEIDINIHPTKTEVKFQDDKSIYAIMKSAVKQSLGKFSITPSIDFNPEKSFDILPLKSGETVKPPTIKINPGYNPFENQNKEKKESFVSHLSLINKSNRDNWEKLYPRHADNQMELPNLSQQEQAIQQVIHSDWDKKEVLQNSLKLYMQLHASFIITQVKTGIMMVDQQLAHERILFEQFCELLEKRISHPQQRQLFPQVVEFTISDSSLIKEIANDIKILGFDIDEFGQGAFVVNGIPADLPESNIKSTLENLLENYKQSKSTVSQNRNTIIAKSLSKNMAVKHGKVLQQEEMSSLIDQLFACKVPFSSVDGKSTLFILSIEELEKRFK